MSRYILVVLLALVLALAATATRPLSKIPHTLGQPSTYSTQAKTVVGTHNKDRLQFHSPTLRPSPTQRPSFPKDAPKLGLHQEDLQSHRFDPNLRPHKTATAQFGRNRPKIGLHGHKKA